MMHSSILTAATIAISTLDNSYLTSSQQAPYYDYIQFEEIPAGAEVPRQNVCDRLQALERGEVILADALKGLDLHPAIAAAEYVILDEKGKLDEGYPGLLPTLLDEIADRAGFRWRNSFGLTWPPEMTEGRTFPDLLEWSVQNFDVCIDWWPNNVDNARRNVALSPAWYDASLILVWNPPEPNDKKFLFSFFAPFTWPVWALTFATLLVSGLIFYFLERMDRGAIASFREHFFLSAITFTGNFSYTPTNNPARLFAWSLTFLSLVWSASYTANLASFLVAKNRPTLVINSIEDAMRVGSICVSDLTNAYDHISIVYPNARFVRKADEVEMFQALNDGECICAATTVVSWRSNYQNIETNPDCKLERIPSIVSYFDGSFGFQASLGWDKCTPLIRDVFQVHMIAMQQEGFIEKAWQYEFERTKHMTCEQKEDEKAETIWDELEEDTIQLGLNEMGGIFVVHYSLTAIALICAGLGHFWGKQHERKGAVQRKKDDHEMIHENDDSNSTNGSDYHDAKSTHSDNFDDNPVSHDFDQNLDDVIAYLRGIRSVRGQQNPSSSRVNRRAFWHESQEKHGKKIKFAGQSTRGGGSATTNNSPPATTHNPWATSRGFGY